ncbi:MAG: sporulation protein YunB [Ruminococcus sp.]|nr:sporulation protein YunB [Ruminococcus sp.]
MRRHRRRKFRGKGILGTAVFLLIIVLLVIAAVRLEKDIRPSAEMRSQQAARSTANQLISAAVADCMAENEYTYESFATILYDETGRAAAVETLSVNVNRIRSELTERINKELAENADIQAKIPLGDLGNSYLFAGKGPKIKLRISSAGSASVDLQSSFESTGINQSCHRITAEITVTLVSALPMYDFETTESFSLLLAESVIVGDIPQGYFEM